VSSVSFSSSASIAENVLSLDRFPSRKSLTKDSSFRLHVSLLSEFALETSEIVGWVRDC
jgi:hypothetical protein